MATMILLSAGKVRPHSLAAEDQESVPQAQGCPLWGGLPSSLHKGRAAGLPTWQEIRELLATSTPVHSLELVSVIVFSRSGSISLSLGLLFSEDLLGLRYLSIQGWRVRGWTWGKKRVMGREWREFGSEVGKESTAHVSSPA